MGMRAQAIEELLRSREPREPTSFSEMGQRPPLSRGEMGALALGLSGASRGAGTFRGVTPQSNIEQGVRALERDAERRDQELMENIKIAGLADEEKARQARRAKQLDPMTRNLLQQRIASLDIPETEKIEVPEDMTFGDIEDNPILQSLSQDLIPKAKVSVKDEIARAERRQFEKKLDQPMSNADRQIVNKYLERLGIDKRFSEGDTYRRVDDNEYLRPLLKNMKALQLSSAMSPRQKQQMRVTEQREARAQRKEQREIETQTKKEESSRKKETQKLSSTLMVSGLPTAWETMNEIESNMPPEGQDIPGAGLTGKAPMMFLSKEGKALRSAFQTLLNVTLKDRSGAAVTVPEFERLKIEFGDFTGATDDDFRKGIARAKRALKATTRAILAGYPEDAYQRYREQGGSDFKSFLTENDEVTNQRTQKTTFPKTVTKDGMQTTVNNQKELDEATAEGWR